ncbi:MAG: AMP-binding protein [Rubrivivax sp.]
MSTDFRATLATAADLRTIEARGPAAFMPHARVDAALAAVAARHGDRPALCALRTADDPSPLRWTHAQLWAEVRRAALLFRALVGADGTPRVALLLPPVPAAWFGLWGAEAAGVACPINHALADDALVALLDAAQVNLVLTLAPEHPAGDIGRRVAALVPRCAGVMQLLSVGGAPAPGALDFDAARAAFDPDTYRVPAVPPGAPSPLAALFHTGGTTGLPKLARHTHANQLHVAGGAALHYAATEDDVILNGFPLFHVAGAFVYGLALLLAGAQIVLPPPLGWRDSAFVARAWRLVRERRITLLATVPTVMAALLAAPREPGDATGVRLLLTGGSPLPPELAQRFEHATGVPVRNILGMTECAGVIAIEPAAAPRHAGSCGLPLPFTEVQAVDDDGRVLPPGGSGVLRVRGPNVGPGYTDPARDAGSFEHGWLITGDIGHVDAHGRVFVTGRAKDVIIRGAHNIDPGAIEEVLLQHPQVQMAAAVGEPDEHAGELPVAYVVARPGTAPTADALLAFVARRIAERAACPKRITVLPALPLTAIGKVYKPALRAQAVQRVIDERLQRAALADHVRATAQDLSGRIVVRVVAPPSTHAQVSALMGGFALDWAFADPAVNG